MGRFKKKFFGELLVEEGLLSPKQVEEILARQKVSNERFGRIAAQMKYISEVHIAEFLARQLDIPLFRLSEHSLDPEVVKIIPEKVARSFGVIAIDRDDKSLTVAMADPLDVILTDDLERLTGLRIKPAAGVPSEIDRAIDQYYGMDSFLKDIMGKFGEVDFEYVKAEEDQEVNLDRLTEIAEEAPVVRLVNLILSKALRDGASDVHIEPTRSSLNIRYRVDGVLVKEELSPPRHLLPAIVTRIKILSNMDIAEKRIPQDGRFHIKIKGREIDIRTSTLPTYYGEKAVMRLLDRSAEQLKLDALGFPEDALRRFEEVIKRPNGIILVTGPTGSGKTTTLYAALNRINSPEKNIVTIEDPIEYQLPMVNQVQVNPKAGLTFASGLRSVLRQDPDIIMVGEIRDAETAQIAVQAALTGHLVFSTLHTNDSPGAIIRLLDFGVQPFLIASTVIAIVSQRLVRVICSACKETFVPPESVLEYIKGLTGVSEPKLYRGKGCPSCLNTGYRGQTGLFEFMEINDRIRELIVAEPRVDDLRRIAKENGMRSLREDGVDKVLRGITTIEEVIRVTQDVG